MEPSGFQVTLSLVDCGVNNFWKGFIDRNKSCNGSKSSSFPLGRNNRILVVAFIRESLPFVLKIAS
jgi:hypothetical protein